MKAKIHNLIIVDESGSMEPLRQATIDGINETLNTIRKAQTDFADTQEHTLTLVTFDTGYHRESIRTVIDNQPIDKVGTFDAYEPGGGTPLYDALGQSLTALHRHISGDPDASAVVTVLTDGMENSSHEWNARNLRALIDRLKSDGWSFAYMGSAHNVKEVSDLLCIDNVVEFSHSTLGTGSTWARENSSRRSYYQKMSAMYSEKQLSRDELLRRKRQMAREYYGERDTPNHITHLEPNEVFVFGSNTSGLHNGGAAATAMRFGAVWGQAEGPQGQCYALPSTGGRPLLQAAVQRFCTYAAQHPDQRFLVTRVGCGTAGFTAHDVAPLFRDCIHLENVTLPTDFWAVLGLKNC